MTIDEANARDEAKWWANFRAQRNAKLKSSDWTQGADVPDSIKTPYAVYRQELRDAPVNSSTENGKIVWPTEPSI
tara:strand:+ start:389 stop:613 length:225 start_codon:yes stop_codon:yes gene_type:complete